MLSWGKASTWLVYIYTFNNDFMRGPKLLTLTTFNDSTDMTNRSICSVLQYGVHKTLFISSNNWSGLSVRLGLRIADHNIQWIQKVFRELHFF